MEEERIEEVGAGGDELEVVAVWHLSGDDAGAVGGE